MVQTHPVADGKAEIINNNSTDEDNFEDAEEDIPKNGECSGINPEDFNLEKLPLRIAELAESQLQYSLAPIGKEWKMFHHDGEMKLHLREETINGHVVDPLKALHLVPGVTAHEMCHYFFKPEFRMAWEITLDSFDVLHNIDDNTFISRNIHKRIWPTTQRDSIFWSHLKYISNYNNSDSDVWIVSNRSCNYPLEEESKCIRVDMKVSLVCQTVVTGDESKRDNVSCKMVYCSTVHPGGWAPTPLLRQVYKKEYPRFMKRFTKYVKDQVKDKPVMM